MDKIKSYFFKKNTEFKSSYKQDNKGRVSSYWILLPFLIFILSFFVFLPQVQAAAGVPKILNYQGRLLDASGNLLGGSGAGTDYCFKFSIYDDATVGPPDNKLWPVGDPSPMTVNVKNGVFNAGIGDTSPGSGGDALDYNFQDNDTIYLYVQVATKVGLTCLPGDGLESFENLAPRQQIFSSGYSINASTVGGFSPSQSASGNQIPVLNAGNLILGGTNPQINVTGSNTLTLSSSAGLILSGTSTFSSGYVGIGTTTPGAELAVVGNIFGTGNITMLGTVTGSNISTASTTNWNATYSIVNASSSKWDAAYGSALINDRLMTIGGLSTTTGNLIVASSTLAGGWTTLAVGTSGQCLQASSSQPGGLAWGPCSSAVAGGLDTYIQYNDGGAFGGDSNFTWDKTNKVLYFGSSARIDAGNYGGSGNYGVILMGDNSSYAASIFANSATQMATFDISLINNQRTFTFPNQSGIFALTSDLPSIASTSNWDLTYTIVNASSSKWDATYFIVNASSSKWDASYSLVNASSSKWDAAYGNVSMNLKLASIGGLATTTGNLIVASSSNTGWTTLAAGVSGQCLQASSSQPSGLAWGPCSNAATNLSGGQTNYIPLWSSASTLSTSTIYQISNGYIGIGTSTPTTTLTVYGTSTFRGGYVGIGTTTPGSALAVVGNIFGTGNITMVGTVVGSNISTASTTSWNATYYIVNASSSKWDATYSLVNASSSKWDAAYGNVSMNLKLASIGGLATTTGNLLVASSSNTGWTTLAVGTSGLCLQASSSQPGGIAWAACNTGPPNLTTGQTNYIPLWSSASTLSTSTIYQISNGYIGIGTTTPTTTLTVYGTSTFMGGYVGIGTTIPGAKLDVNGSLRVEGGSNPILKANWDPNDGNVMNGATSVYVSGKYAYVTGWTSDNLAIVDISNPSRPTTVGNWVPNDNNVMNSARSVYVSGKYAYVAGYNSSNLAIVDISNPSSPTTVGNWDPNDSNVMDYAESVYVSGKYAYVAGGVSDNLVIVDISNPARPTTVANWDPNDGNVMNGANSVYVSGKYAYVTGMYSFPSFAGNLAIVDISNPSSPTTVGNWYPSSTAVMNFPYSVYVSGKYAYVAGNGSDNLVIVDISNPSRPTTTGNWDPNDGNVMNGPESVYVSGKYAYVAGSNSSNTAIVDISNPSNPTTVGNWDPNDGNVMDGAVSVYVSGKYAYVVGGVSDNLAIVDIGGIETPNLYAGTINTDTFMVNDNAIINNNAYVQNGLNVGPGGLYVDSGEVAFDANSSSTAFTFGQRGLGDILNVFDNTTEVFTILDGGNIGIGTSTPISTLTVYGTTTLMGGYVGIGTTTPTSILTVYGTTTLMGGYVGIGTTTPGSALAVVGNIFGTGNISMAGTVTGSNISTASTTNWNAAYGNLAMNLKLASIGGLATATGNLLVASSSNTGWTVLAVGTSGLCLQASSSRPGGIAWAACNTGPPNLTTGQTNYIPLWSSASTLSTSTIYQISNGYIGIGTTTPTTTFTVYGTSTFMGGYVGIGTTIPGAKLDVNGSLRVEGGSNPVLKANWDLNDTNVMDSADSVYVSGKYAYVAGYDSDNLVIVDISNPSRPTTTGNWDPNVANVMESAQSVYVSGKYAYVVGFSSDNLAIVDISNPSSPTTAGNWDPNDNNVMNGPYLVYVSGKYAYVVGWSSKNLAIVDISNPANPTTVGNWDPNDDNVMSQAVSVYVSGKYAYVAGYTSSNLVIVDISNPSSPTTVGNWDPNDGNVMNLANSVYVSGKYAYVAGRNSSNLAIVDISNPASPTTTGNWKPNDNNVMGNADSVFVSGKYAYVAGYTSDNLAIVDISNPSSPTTAGNWDPNNNNVMDIAFSVYVSGKYAYVTGNLSDNLVILDIGGIETPNLYAGTINTDTFMVNDNAIINNNAYVQNGLNVGPGGLYVDSGEVAFDANSSSTAFTFGQRGLGDILNVFDNTTEVFTILDGGYIGIGTTTPGAELSVVGNIFGTGNISMVGTVTGSNISTASTTNWNAAYYIVNASSSKWDSTYSIVNASSSKWDLTYSLVNASSSNWDKGYAGYVIVNASSSKWDATYSIVNASSSNWDAAYGNLEMNLKLSSIGSLATTTGNLIVASSSNTGWTTLAVGTSGLCLQASSSQPGGITWGPCGAVVGGGLTGGQANYIPLWTSDSALSTSTIYQDGTFIGIGTSTPTTTLTVYGTSTFLGGYVGIGTTTPSSALTISSNATSGEVMLIEANNLETGIGLKIRSKSSGGGDLAIFEALGAFTGDVLNISGGSMLGRGLYVNGGAGINPAVRIEGGTRTGSVLELTSGPSNSFIIDATGKGSERFVVTSNGYVGIGTPTPTTTLTVYGTSTFSGGYVGIGTTTPGVELAVVGNIFGTGNITTLGTVTGSNISTASTTNWNAAYYIVNASSSKWDSTYFLVNASSSKWDAAYGNVSMNLKLASIGGLATTTGNLLVASSSNTGWTILAVAGNGLCLQASSSQPTGLIWSPCVSISGSQTNYLSIWTSSTTQGTSTIYQSGTFIGIGTSTPTSTLTVYGTTTLMGGYVGIGTLSPGAKLDVNGSLRVEGGSNPVLKGNWKPNDTNVMDGAYSVYVSGKYAYVAGYSSDNLAIVDISNPSSPTTAGNWDPNDDNVMNGAYSVYVSGKYAYVAGDTSDNLAIVDISNPSSPTTVGNWDPNDNNVMNGATSVYVSGKYAYVAGIYSSNTAIVDISNPSSPTTVGNWDPNNGNVMDTARSVYVSGKYAYVAGDTSKNLAIVDISNPSSPTTVGNWDPNDTNVMNAARSVYVSGKYAYVAGWLSSNLAIVDISNPANPTTVGNWDPNNGNVMDTARSVYVSGKYAYVTGWTSDNLAIVDISNPSSPTTVGNWDPNDTNVMNAARSVYVSGKYAYVAGQSSANLAIVDIGGIETPNLYAGSVNSDTFMVNDNAIINNNAYVQNGLNVGPGGLYVDSGEVAFDANSSSTAFTFGQKGLGDILNVFDNTTEVFTILDGGNIGIGTSTPISTLTVYGTSTFMGGYVGIGTTTPGAELSVVGNIFGTGNITMVGTVTGSNISTASTTNWNAAYGDQWTNYKLMQIGGFATTTGNLVVASGTTGWTTVGVGTVNQVLTASSTAPGGIAWAPIASSSRWDAAYGNLAMNLKLASIGGLATTTGNLLVASSSNTGWTILAVAGNGLCLQASSSQPTGLIWSPCVSISGSQTGYLSIWTSSTTQGTSTIYQSGTFIGIGTSTPTTTLTVYGTSTLMGGYVGIGTLSPGAKLDVKGNLRVEGGSNPVLKGNWKPNVANVMDTAVSVYVSGKYAYVAGSNSSNTAIVDISNPANPTTVGNWDPNDANVMNAAASVYVSGKYAYVAGGLSNNLAIVDISNPSSPTTVGNWDPNDNNVMNTPRSVCVSGKYAYVAGTGSNNLAIVDISNPSSPTTVGNWDPNDTNVMNAPSSVYVSGKYAYVTGVISDNFAIVDISNPSSPTTVGNWDPNVANVMDAAYSVYVSGKYAYVAGSNSSNTAIVDISNPANPTTVGNWDPNDANVMNSAISVYVSGKYAYVAGQTSDNLAIVDISNPSSPTTVGNWDPNDGNVMAYPRSVYVSGKYAYVAGYTSDNLAIVDIGGIETPNLFAGSVNSDTFMVNDNAIINNNAYVQNGLNVGPGGLYVDSGEVAFDANSSSTAFTFGQKGLGDILNVFDNTTEVFTILDGGNIGIGTSTPISTLTVYGTSTFMGGYVGIGTTTPGAELSVVGNIFGTGNITTLGTVTGSNISTASTTNWNAAYYIVNASSSKWDSTYFLVNASSSKWDAAYGNLWSNYRQSQIGGFATTTGNLIVASGTAGWTTLAVGTVNQALVASSTAPGGVAWLTLPASSASLSGGQANYITKWTSDSAISTTTIFEYTNGFIGIGTSTPTTTLTVYGTTTLMGGYVGIGTLSPGAKLDVNGSLRVEGGSNPVLKGNWDPNDGNIMNGAYSVYVSGKYAYVAGGYSDNLAIVDISNPSSPTTVGNWDPDVTNVMDYPESVYVSGKYAYVAGAGSDNLAIVDISNPSSPTTVGNWDPNDLNVMWAAESVYVSGKYAYVGGFTSSNLVIVDISNPSSPTTVGNWDPNDLNVMHYPSSVYVSGKYAYVAGAASYNLAIVDISNPSSPTTVGNWDPNNTTTMDYPSSVYVSGKYAYVAGAGSDNLAIVDISNPSSPTTVGNWDPNDLNVMDVARSVYVSGKYAYVAGYNSSNTAIVDISNPSSPTTVGNWNYYDANVMSGAWSVYVSGKYAYVAGVESDNLAIIDIGGIETPNLFAGSINSDTFMVNDNAIINNNAYVQNGLNVGPGGLYVDSGEVSFDGNSSSTAFTFGQRGLGDILNVFDNTTEVFTILDGGYIGIGTSTPTTTLTVYGTSTFLGGYVGIGTTTPGGPLSVVGNIFGTGNISMIGTVTGSNISTASTSNWNAAYGNQWTNYKLMQIGGFATTTGNLIVASGTAGWTTVGVGTANQVLVASSTAPGGIAWAPIASSSYWDAAYGNLAMNLKLASIGAIATTTGNLLVASSTNTGWSVLTVGTTGYLLTASSSAPGGIAWAPLASSSRWDAAEGRVTASSSKWDAAYGNLWSNYRQSQIGGFATTTGNLVVASGTAGWTTVGVGTVNQVLTASSTAPGGMAWLTLPASSGGVTSLNTLTGALNIWATSSDQVYLTASGTQGWYLTLPQDIGTNSAVRFGNIVTSGNVNATGSITGSNITVASTTAWNAAYGDLWSNYKLMQIGGFATTTGNLIVGSSTSGWTTVGVGTTGYYLMASSGAPAGVAWQPAPATSLTGGQINYIPLWSSDTALSTSTIYQEVSKGYIGIGTTTPTTTLSVYGTTTFSGGGIIFNSNIGSNFAMTAVGSAPSIDMFNISNYGLGVTNAGVSAIEVNYFGGSAAIESSAVRVDLTPGTLTGSTWNAFRVAASTTGAVAGVAEAGLSIEGPTSPGAGTEIGLTFANNWDYEINFEKPSSTIRIATTTLPMLSFVDSSTTAAALFRIKGFNNIFGGMAESGAFIEKNSYFGEEFNLYRWSSTTMVTGPPNSVWGQRRGSMYAGWASTAPPQTATGSGYIATSAYILTALASSTCNFSNPNKINGVERIQPVSTASGGTGTTTCSEFITDGRPGNNLLQQYELANLPVITIKAGVSTTTLMSKQRFVIGISTTTSATNTIPNMGLFFTNCATLGCNVNGETQWIAGARNGTTYTTSSCNGQTILPNKFAYMRIEARKQDEIHFFLDNDVSNGINETECGTGTFANLPPATTDMGMYFMAGANSAAMYTFNLDIDYFRAWQDDSGVMDSTPPAITIEDTPATTTPFDARKLLMDLTSGKDALASSTDIQQYISDRLIANLEIIAPSILADGLTINTISAFDKELSLKGDVIFFGRPYFTTDTGGFAVVKSGERKVDVVFEREYLEQPIVNAAISLEQDNAVNDELIFSNNINYIITKKSVNGFTIILNKPAPEDIKFSWIALAVQNAKTFNSTENNTQPAQGSSPQENLPAETLPASSTDETAPATSTDSASASPEPSDTSSEPETSEPPAESSTEPSTEPAIEPVTEPVVEPVTEPVTEPAAEPVSEPVP